jgi:UDP-glucose 4-epimerase
MGTDYVTPDGTAIRDYIHVMDLADAHIRALEHLSGASGSVALNLGIGRGYSVREVVGAVQRAGGRPVPFSESGRRAGDPPVLVADTTRARKLLAWNPQYTSLDAIVKTALQWHSSRSTLALSAAGGR